MDKITMRQTLEAAYAAGWCAAANWADREDLTADIGSEAYADERNMRLEQVAKNQSGWRNFSHQPPGVK